MKEQTTETPRVYPLSVLKQRNFLLFWVGQAISLTGGWMQGLALSWATMQLVSGAIALGFLNFISALPPILLLLHGGVAADKFDKRRILLVTQFVFMLNAFVMAFLVGSGLLEYWHIIGLSLVIGVGFAFDMPANQALVPELVKRDQIPSAVQLNQAIFHGSRMLGPSMAGWLIGKYGTYSAFVANGISFLPVILTLMVIRPIRFSEKRPHSGALAAMKEGFEYVRQRPQLLALLGLTALNTILAFPNYAILMPFYVKNVLNLGAGAMGTVMTFGGGGAFLGAMSLLLVPENKRLSRIGWGIAGVALGMLVLGVGPAFGQAQTHGVAHNMAMTCVGVALLSYSTSSAIGLVATILQQTVPDELRGRVMSLQTMAFMGIMPLGSLLMPWLVDVMTMPVELMLAGILYGVLGFLLFSKMFAAAEAQSVP